MALNTEGLMYITPLLAFLLVFIIAYVVMNKTKLFGETKFVQAITALIIGVIFLTISGAVDYITMITPWIVALLVVMFFMIMIISLSGKEIGDIMKPWVVWLFVIILAIIVIIGGVNIFRPETSPIGLKVTNFTTTGESLGTVLVISIGILLAWMISRE